MEGGRGTGTSCKEPRQLLSLPHALNSKEAGVQNSHWSIVSKKKKRGSGGRGSRLRFWHTWSAHWAKWCHPSGWTLQFAIYFLINQTWAFLQGGGICASVCVCETERHRQSPALTWRALSAINRVQQTASLIFYPWVRFTMCFIWIKKCLLDFYFFLQLFQVFSPYINSQKV